MHKNVRFAPVWGCTYLAPKHPYKLAGGWPWQNALRLRNRPSREGANQYFLKPILFITKVFFVSLLFATLRSFNSPLNIFYKSPCVLHVLAITSSSSLFLLAHNCWVLGASSHTLLFHLSSPNISDLTPHMAPRAAPLWTSRALSEGLPSLSTSGHPSSSGTLRLKALVQRTCVNPTNAVFPSFCAKTAVLQE